MMTSHLALTATPLDTGRIVTETLVATLKTIQDENGTFVVVPTPIAQTEVSLIENFPEHPIWDTMIRDFGDSILQELAL